MLSVCFFEAQNSRVFGLLLSFCFEKSNLKKKSTDDDDDDDDGRPPAQVPPDALRHHLVAAPRRGGRSVKRCWPVGGRQRKLFFLKKNKHFKTCF